MEDSQGRPSLEAFDFLIAPGRGGATGEGGTHTQAPGEGETIVRLQQQSTGAIGAKLYPGALLLCAHLRARPLPQGAVVLELGAGVCALPSLWLSRCGVCAIATDIPAMLPLLSSNLRRAGGRDLAEGISHDGDSGSLTYAPLTWGTPGDVHALHEMLRGARIDYIVAADVIYHDPLIQPLLDALLALTEWGADATPPPPILLSYVQRFKRARRFFKLAGAHFDIVQVAGRGRGPSAAGGAASASCTPGGGLVVDYDALSWTLPQALRLVQRAAHAAEGGDGGPPCSSRARARCASYVDVPLITVEDAEYETHCATLVAAAAAAAAAADADAARVAVLSHEELPPTHASATVIACAAHGTHRVGDSDSGDEWGDAQGAMDTFASGVGVGLHAEAKHPTQAAAQRAAAALRLPFPEPVDAYVYELRRRRR